MAFKNFKSRPTPTALRSSPGTFPDVDERAGRDLDHRARSDLKQTTADAAVKGVVITSAKEAFCAGADLSMLDGMNRSTPRC